MRTLFTALFVAALIGLPALSDAGCRLYTLCEDGTSADQPCVDSGGDAIAVKVHKGGRHTIYLDKVHTDNVCTANVYEGLDDTVSKQRLVGSMSCQGTESLNTAGPSEALFVDFDGGVTGTTPGAGVKILACD